MKKHSPQNFNCEFSPEIVDFIYGEMTFERKNVFDQHLSNCSICAVEIEDFSDVRFSIKDWKSTEFDNISTPHIQIPFENAPTKTIASVKTVSWFETVKNYLTLSPVLSGALAVIILAVILSVGVFIFISNQSEMIALSNQSQNINVKPTVITHNSDEPEKSAIAENQDSTDKRISSDKNNIPIEKKIVNKTVPVKVIEKTSPKQNTQTVRTFEKKQVVSETLNSDKNTKVSPKSKKPRLNELPEEDEDNTLRLADLFAELDTRE